LEQGPGHNLPSMTSNHELSFIRLGCKFFMLYK
jgi:hypothetical protein